MMGIGGLFELSLITHLCRQMTLRDYRSVDSRGRKRSELNIMNYRTPKFGFNDVS